MAQSATVAGTSGSFIFKEDWAAALQQELDEPNKYEEIANVVISDLYQLHNPYLTDPTVSTLSPGTPYSFSALTRTDETYNLDTRKVIPQFVDRAFLAQTGYDAQMNIAKRQAVVLKESIESAMYADHASFTDFGTENLTGGSGATAITVSSSNIDDITTSVVRTIRTNNGEGLLNQNGGFIVWRPADFELVQRFAMANGYSFADQVLKNGVPQGFYFGGLYHYTSNFLASGHLFAGVRKLYQIGILRATFGQIMVNPYDPNLQSGVSVVSRVDFGVKAWTKVKPVLYDINVN